VHSQKKVRGRSFSVARLVSAAYYLDMNAANNGAAKMKTEFSKGATNMQNSTNDAAKDWALEIVDHAMSDEQREDIRRRGSAESWRDGINQLDYPEHFGERPATADVLREIERWLGV
jgi:hypothetical protein